MFFALKFQFPYFFSFFIFPYFFFQFFYCCVIVNFLDDTNTRESFVLTPPIEGMERRICLQPKLSQLPILGLA